MRRRAHCFSVRFDNFSGTKQKKADDIQQMKEKLKDGYKVLLIHLSEIWFKLQLSNKIHYGMNTDFTMDDFENIENSYRSQIKKLEESLMAATTRYIEAFDMNNYYHSLIKSHEHEKFQFKKSNEDKDMANQQLIQKIEELKEDKKNRAYEFEIVTKENRKYLQRWQNDLCSFFPHF